MNFTFSWNILLPKQWYQISVVLFDLDQVFFYGVGEKDSETKSGTPSFLPILLAIGTFTNMLLNFLQPLLIPSLQAGYSGTNSFDLAEIIFFTYLDTSIQVCWFAPFLAVSSKLEFGCMLVLKKSECLVMVSYS